MTHIMQRRDTAANWTSTNPVLMAGEAGHESNTGKWKLGDGITAWNALPYKTGVDSVAGKTGAVTLTIADVTGAAPLADPVFTGNPTAPTPANSDNDTTLATTAFVKNQGYAPAASPTFTGDPKAPTPATTDDDTTIATTAFVQNVIEALLNRIYPIGHIYISEANTDPGTFLGGTWVAHGVGRVLVGVDPGQTEFDTAGETGGVKEVTLTAAQSGNPVTNTVRQVAGGNFYFNVGSDADANHRAVLTGPSDAATAHTNLQPYQVVYMFKRTA